MRNKPEAIWLTVVAIMIGVGVTLAFMIPDTTPEPASKPVEDRRFTIHDVTTDDVMALRIGVINDVKTGHSYMVVAPRGGGTPAVVRIDSNNNH